MVSALHSTIKFPPFSGHLRGFWGGGILKYYIGTCEIKFEYVVFSRKLTVILVFEFFLNALALTIIKFGRINKRIQCINENVLHFSIWFIISLIFFYFVVGPVDFDVYRLSADAERKYVSKIVRKMHKLLSHAQCTCICDREKEKMSDHKKVVLAEWWF